MKYTIEQILKRGYDKLIVPIAMSDVPIEMEQLKKEDGTYYTINQLHAEYGSLFTPAPIIDERFILIRWSFNKTGTEAMFKEYLEGKGLADMRDGNLDVDDIDYDNLPDNSFGNFTELEITQVPKIQGYENER